MARVGTSIFYVFILCLFLFPRTIYASICLENFKSLFSTAYQDMKYHLRILPKGTQKYQTTPDHIDQNLKDLSQKTLFTGAWEFLDSNGNTLLVSAFVGKNTKMPTEVVAESLWKVMGDASQHGLVDQVAVVRLRHYEPGPGIRLGDFSGSIRKHCIEFKFNLENNGFEHAAFEFQYVAPSLATGELFKKGLIIPAHLNWRDGDYSAGRTLRRRAISQEGIRAGQDPLGQQ